MEQRTLRFDDKVTIRHAEQPLLRNAELETLSAGNIELDPAQHTAFARTKKLTYGPVYVRATGNLRLQMPLRSQPSNGRES